MVPNPKNELPKAKSRKTITRNKKVISFAHTQNGITETRPTLPVN